MTSHYRIYVIVAACLLVLALLVWFLLVIPHQKERAASAPPPTQDGQLRSAAEPPPSVPEPASQAQKVPLRLGFSFSAETWIQVYADGELKINGLKQAGEKVECDAQKEFVIRTGNAGGFALTLNGKPGKSLGGPGVVLNNIRITPDNYDQFLLSAEKAEPTSSG